MDAGDLEGSSTDLQEAAKLAPGDKPVRLALKSLRIKQKEVEAARRSLWGGVFKRGAAKTTAPGRRQVEEAAARARGERLQDPGRGVTGEGASGGTDCCTLRSRLGWSRLLLRASPLPST
ncbi:unnamed protein product, partial [Ectocarpus sp. 6 AP-2014]